MSISQVDVSLSDRLFAFLKAIIIFLVRPFHLFAALALGHMATLVTIQVNAGAIQQGEITMIWFCYMFVGAKISFNRGMRLLCYVCSNDLYVWCCQIRDPEIL